MSMPASPPLLGAAIVALIAILTLIGCSTQDPVSRGRIHAFNQPIEFTLIGVNRERAAEIGEILQHDLEIMEEAWRPWGDGPLVRVNQLLAELDTPFASPPSVLPLLRLSKALSEQSDGLFNPAIGHLWRAWGLQGQPRKCQSPPSPERMAPILQASPGMQDIVIDGFRISSANRQVKLDFRGIQIGFAVDQAIARLQDLGIHNASVNVAGNLRAIGSRDGRPWSVPVRGPDGGGVLATLEIFGNEAAFTLTRDRHAFTAEGRRYHDILDPRTGYPAEGSTSVTVLHPNASTADAAANALFVAGPDDWSRVARQMGIRYVMLTDEQGRIHMNPAMQARAKLHATHREVIISAPLF